MEPIALDLLDKVNGFYNNGFGHLLLYTALLFGAIGVAVPLLIQYIQNRNYRHDAKVAKEEANQLVTKLVAERLPQLVKAESEKALESAEARIAVALCGVYFLQGTMCRKENDFAFAAFNYAYAAVNGLKGNDDQDAQRAMKILIEECLPKLTRADYKTGNSFEPAVSGLLKELRARNVNGRFTDDINPMTVLLETSKAQPAPPAQLPS